MEKRMLCPTCRGAVTYTIKGSVEAYCTRCGGFLGLAGIIKQILIFNKKPGTQ